MPDSDQVWVLELVSLLFINPIQLEFSPVASLSSSSVENRLARWESSVAFINNFK